MKYRTLFSVIGLLLSPTFAFGACSIANLTRCLDSVCGINMGANPAARCQYCGSASAGAPAKSQGMKSVTAGSAAKYTISDKELKKAPSDPGERYVWATEKCLEKMDACTTDDVTDNYDSLIEQSCKAAGIAANFANLTKKIGKEKSANSCSTEISSCLINSKRCSADYRNCEDDANFDKFFAECALASQGCDAHTKDIRAKLLATRDSTLKNTEQILTNIVTAYQDARKKKLEGTRASCKDGSAKNSCVNAVCNNNMRHKCEVGYEFEKALAQQLCKFYDIACERLK